MKELSKIALAVNPSSTMAIDSLAKQMKADGLDVIGFGAGEPDFPTPDFIKQAGIDAIKNNDTRYTPAVGTLELRNVIAKRLETDFGISYQPSQICVSNGAKPCVWEALRALINPGDEIILPAPYWVSYIELVKMAGAIPVIVETEESAQFKMTASQLKNAITPKTKVLILNNPSNPSGMVYTRKELEEIAKVCVEEDIYVISDEIYCNLIYDGEEFVSFAAISEEIKERTILINGVSKSYAMTGWRIGYLAANAQIAKVIANHISHSTGSPSAISQKASVIALGESQQSVFDMRDEFEKRRNFMVTRMNELNGVSCIMPQGAFYVMMNIEKMLGKTLFGEKIETSDDFASLLLKKAKVAVVPGSGFGAPNFIRWSYATSLDNIKKGLDRLEKFLQEEEV